MRAPSCHPLTEYFVFIVFSYTNTAPRLNGNLYRYRGHSSSLCVCMPSPSHLVQNCRPSHRLSSFSSMCVYAFTVPPISFTPSTIADQVILYVKNQPNCKCNYIAPRCLPYSIDNVCSYLVIAIESHSLFIRSTVLFFTYQLYHPI